jgi:hypothetical protein
MDGKSGAMVLREPSKEVSRIMTLEAYDPERLDALALRTLDVCARLRNLARTSREAQLPAVELHDRKALEWLEKLELWAIDAEGELHKHVERSKGNRAAEPYLKGSRPK